MGTALRFISLPDNQGIERRCPVNQMQLDLVYLIVNAPGQQTQQQPQHLTPQGSVGSVQSGVSTQSGSTQSGSTQPPPINVPTSGY